MGSLFALERALRVGSSAVRFPFLACASFARACAHGQDRLSTKLPPGGSLFGGCKRLLPMANAINGSSSPPWNGKFSLSLSSRERPHWLSPLTLLNALCLLGFCFPFKKAGISLRSPICLCKEMGGRTPRPQNGGHKMEVTCATSVLRLCH